MIYQWKFNGLQKVDAQTAGEVFEKLEKTVGLTPKNVLDASREETAPLHNEFEWDNTVAAEKWREEQARSMIVNIAYVTEKESDPEKPQIVRAFYHVDEKHTYETTDTVLKVQSKREKLFDIALKELVAFQKKYSILSELQPIMSEIDKLIGENQ